MKAKHEQPLFCPFFNPLVLPAFGTERVARPERDRKRVIQGYLYMPYSFRLPAPIRAQRGQGVNHLDHGY